MSARSGVGPRSTKWTSLVCAVFLLLFCLTGLPLIFKHELRELERGPALRGAAGRHPRASLDTIVAAARRRHPDHVPMFVFVDDDEPKVKSAACL